jgi:hypothetical protein
LEIFWNWVKPVISLITGGILWEGIKFFYPSLNQRIKNYKDGRKAFYSSVDPILKSADELYGKIFSLSKEDFATFINPTHSFTGDIEHNKKYVIYLFAQFWAQLESIRLKSQYTSLTELKKGRQLINYIETIESRSFRVLDRSVQRVIGEILIEGATSTFRVMNLNQFIRNYDDKESEIYKWAHLIEDKLNSTDEKKVRQRILVFGVIVASLIDHLDPEHKIIHPNEIYKNKLSSTSKNVIRGKLLSHYLKFVTNKRKYY